MAEKRVTRRAEMFTLNIGGKKKEFCIRTLVRRDAMFVMHTTIRPVLQTIVELIADKTSSGSMKGDVNPAEMIVGFKNLIDAADFDTIDSIARPLFDQAMVNGDDIDYEDYFGENTIELYPALYKALSANYPDVFQILQPIIARASATLKDLTSESKPPEPPSEA